MVEKVIKNTKKMTHGETYLYRRENLDFTKEIKKLEKTFVVMPKRMNREDAMKYYGKKLRIAFGIKDQDDGDFINIDHRFDYYEAQNFLEQIGRA